MIPRKNIVKVRLEEKHSTVPGKQTSRSHTQHPSKYVGDENKEHQLKINNTPVIQSSKLHNSIFHFLNSSKTKVKAKEQE